MEVLGEYDSAEDAMQESKTTYKAIKREHLLCNLE